VPKQYGLEGFAIVLFCASLAMTLMVGACFFRVCVFSHTWFPDIWAAFRGSLPASVLTPSSAD
jgi:hypothetical protein